MKIVIDKDIPFIKGVLEPHAAVVYLAGGAIAKKDVQDADALIIRTRTKCNADLLAGTKVQFIASATIGFDHIDTEFCEKNGITWTNAKGCNAASVHQYIAAVLFHLSNKLEFRLEGGTIGVVGVGNVGSRVATLCSALGMRVLLNDPPRARKEGQAGFVSLDTIVTEADIITFHVPLDYEGQDRTYHMVDRAFLQRLRPSQIMINTSRGEVIDTPALRTKLSDRGLAACVLDVWEHEPTIDTELLTLVTVGTPHIAGYSADGKANGTSMSVRAVSRHFGLGLDDWFPGDVPLPATTLLELETSGLPRQKIACKLVTKTYDLLADDQRLRNSPQTFEQQRAHYPLRREFSLYSARLLHADEPTRAMVRTIGFKIVS